MKQLITFLCLLFIVAGCKKNGSGAIHIEGFDLFDGSGNAMGHVGREDEDWTFNNTLSEKEMALFDFPANITLDHTTEATIQLPRSIPNPATYASTFYANTSDSVLARVVMVNSNLEVMYQVAKKVKGSMAIAFQVDDRNKFHDPSSFRVYYSFSATGKPNYKAGYGDIRVCENYASCFK